MHLSALLYGVIYFAVAQQPAASPDTVVVDPCIIFLDEEAKVPAQEGGVIDKLYVKEGQTVKSKEKLVQIDDSIPRQQLIIAAAEWNAAKVKAENQVPRDYAVASRDVAYAELNVSLDANRRIPGVVPKVNIKKMELECTQMELSIKKADMDTVVAEKEADVKKAQMDASETALKHRLLQSPLSGEGLVGKIYRHVGEWVQNGEPVVYVLRMDRLRVEGSLPASKISPSEVAGKPVEIEVELAHERIVKFRGNIVFVDPKITTGGEYLVRAEVENRKENNQWILHPGLTAKMTIQLK
jgi:multidrug efflux pump subunit AcrA (membrane-fusion protein)